MNHKINQVLRYIRTKEEEPQTAEALLSYTPVYDRLRYGNSRRREEAYNDQSVIYRASYHDKRLGLFVLRLNIIKYEEAISKRIRLSMDRFTAQEHYATVRERYRASHLFI